MVRKIWPWSISWCNQIWLWIRYKSGNLNRLSKMLRNGSKFSILFVGKILLVRLVVIPLYGCFPEVSKLYGTKNNCTIQLGVIYVPVLQHRAHWITWVVACHSQSFVNLWLLWYRHWDLMTWSRSLGYGSLL